MTWKNRQTLKTVYMHTFSVCDFKKVGRTKRVHFDHAEQIIFSSDKCCINKSLFIVHHQFHPFNLKIYLWKVMEHGGPKTSLEHEIRRKKRTREQKKDLCDVLHVNKLSFN